MTVSLTLTRTDRDKLAKIAGLLGSDHPAERAVAAMKATELLEGLGATWADLVASVPSKLPPRFHTRPETRLAAARMGVSV